MFPWQCLPPHQREGTNKENNNDNEFINDRNINLIIHTLPITRFWEGWSNLNYNRVSIFSRRRRLLYELIRCRTFCNLLLSDRYYIWGIDLSLNGAGIAIIDVRNGNIMLDRYSTTANIPLFDRSYFTMKWLKQFYLKYTPLGIIMEGTFMNLRNPGVSLVLSRFNHAIEVGLYELGGCLYRSVMPRSIKKYTTNNDRATKEEMQKELQKKFGIWIYSNDMSDALGMALMGYDIYRLFTKLDLDSYDINSKQSMRVLENDCSNFVGDKTKFKSLFNILISSWSITNFYRPTKTLAIRRIHPKTLIFNSSGPIVDFVI